MSIEDLIWTTAAAIAPRYDELDFGDCEGVLLYPSFGGEPEELAPLALELRAGEVTPDVHRDGYQEELGSPELPAEIGRALCDHLAQAPDGYVLIERFWLALADELHARFGLPVLVCEIEMSISEQLERHLATSVEHDPLARLDVRISERIDEHRVAAVWFDEEMQYMASARAPRDARPVGLNTELSLDPEVRAGWLPPGAAGIALQDRTGAWHSARCAGNVWLSVLPQRAGQYDPHVSYRDVNGTPFTRAITTRTLPGLWPLQAPGPPRLAASSDDFVSYASDGWAVSIRRFVGFQDIAFRPIAGSILGEPYGIGVELTGDGWRAVTWYGTFTVEVQVGGTHKPPDRLDLHTIAG